MATCCLFLAGSVSAADYGSVTEAEVSANVFFLFDLVIDGDRYEVGVSNHLRIVVIDRPPPLPSFNTLAAVNQVHFATTRHHLVFSVCCVNVDQVNWFRY